MSIQAKNVSPSCVLLGNFNPTIFHPSWMEKTQLFRDEEIEHAEINLIHPDLAIVKISGIDFRIERQRFQAITADASKEDLLLDSISGFFTLLADTPLNGIGINWQAHFDLKNEKLWHEFGHRLAPKEPWKEICEQSGLKNLRIEGKNPYEDNGNLYITVEPSLFFKFGVRVELNNHFVLKNNNGTDQALTLLSQHWKNAQKDSSIKAKELFKDIKD